MTNFCYPPKPIVKSSQITPAMPDSSEPTASAPIKNEPIMPDIITTAPTEPCGPFCTYNADEIHTVEQYLKAVEKVYRELCPEYPVQNKPILWFRGLKSENYSLLPAIARSQTPNRIENENIILIKFQAMAAPYLPDMPVHSLSSLREYYWRSLFMMQRYGIATRILDWTEDALKALLFAIDGKTTEEEEKANPVVWCLNPLKLNQAFDFASDIPDIKEKGVYQLFGPLKTDCENKRPCAVWEEFILNKTLSQKNTFTVFPSCQDLTAMEKLPASNAFLTKIIIARDCREYLNEQLNKYGLPKEELKPELIAIANRIK